MSDLKEVFGKNIFIWSIDEIYKGDVFKIAKELQTAHFQSVILHSTRTSNWKQTNRINLVKALQEIGIHVFGGCAVYGDSPTAEGKRAAAFCNDYGLLGWVFDAEQAFDNVKSPDSAASNLLRGFKQNAPDKLAGWCWWAFYQSKAGATYHPKGILWAATDDAYGDADFGIPMTYWSWGDDAENAVKYLEESWRQWRLITDKPIIPAGRAYVGDGGSPTPEAMKAFEQRARELGAPGISWWSMQHALNTSTVPHIWNTLSNMKPFSTNVETPIETHWYDGLSDHEILMDLLTGKHTL